MSEHPFLSTSFYVPWSSLQPANLEQDITAALAAAQQRIDAIAALPLTEASFSNTILALEGATRDLSRAWGYADHLSSVEDSPALRTAYNALLPKVSAFYTGISLNAELWQRVKAGAQSAEGRAQQGVYQRLIEETLADFRESGADLPAEKKARLEAVEQELSTLTQKYSENVLDSTNAWEYVTADRSEIAGLPPFAVEAARQSALQKGLGSEAEPQWRFTQQGPSLMPVMRYAHSDALRKRVWEGGNGIAAQGGHDNAPLVVQILKLRQEKAELLGYADFADLVLKRRMAQTGSAALEFIEDLHAKVRPAFLREFGELEKFRSETLLAEGRAHEAVEPLQPWQAAYWSERLRQARYAFDEEELRPYFSLQSVIEGMFSLCERLFGIRVQPRTTVFIEPENGREHVLEVPGDDEPAEVWHGSVRVYDLFDAESDVKLGAFYTDWFPRASKRGGAWMNALSTGGPRKDGSFAPQLGLIAGNMSEPQQDSPALMTHDEVQTIFHEFGHLLHHLCGKVPVPSLNGIHVAWDFVELPSQILENWCWERDALDLFARHYKSEEAIPEALFSKMQKARTCMEAMATMRQLAFSKMDLELHRHAKEINSPADLDARIDAFLDGYSAPYAQKAPNIIRRFSHLFSSPTGYAAAYYSYKWAEVLDADAFTRFKKEGVLNGKTGKAFREAVLEKGNSLPPQECFALFMGREPDASALLERAGIR